MCMYEVDDHVAVILRFFRLPSHYIVARTTTALHFVVSNASIHDFQARWIARWSRLKGGKGTRRGLDQYHHAARYVL